MNYYDYHRRIDLAGWRNAISGGLVRLAKGSPGSLCTMFAFQGVEDPNLLHCTHKYFGAGTASKEDVIKELERHFGANPFKPFQADFNKIDHFGEDKDYRVVRPQSDEPFHLPLKAKLDALEPDKFPKYLPHVTVGRNVDKVDYPIRDYVLMEDHKPVWSAADTYQRLRAETRASVYKIMGRS